MARSIAILASKPTTQKPSAALTAPIEAANLSLVFARAVQSSSRLVSRLLSEDSIFELVQRSLAGTLSARRVFERNVVRLLATANVPSRQDLDRLLERVDGIDREVDDLIRRIRTITEALAEEDPALRKGRKG